MSTFTLFIFAILANAFIGYFAYRKNTLTLPDGVIAAAITGILIFMAQPILWILLMVFFVSANALTRYKETSITKEEAMTYAEKVGKRDMWQVIANGGIATIIAILILYDTYFQKRAESTILILGAVIALAASTADTWSTEIGTTSTKEPMWIFNFTKRVPRGTSGGISIKGVVGAILGSILIAGVFAIYQLMMHINLIIVISSFSIIIFGGTLGSFIDTILGASFQAVYYCEVCNKQTEKKIHTKCGGTPTVHYKGFKWLTNDTVNFLSPLIATLISLIVWFLIIN